MKSMRQIKFRAWDKKEREMIPAIGLTEDGTPFLMKSIYKEKIGDDLRKQNASCLAFGKDEIVIMQFTGLLDKNGKDIYEGDIVSEGYHNKYGTFQVKWEKCGFNLNTGGDGSFTILGNIHETPELLNNIK